VSGGIHLGGNVWRVNLLWYTVLLLLLLLQLTVIQGDITQIDADAIVHPTNSALSFGGQIGQYMVIPVLKLYLVY